MSKSLNHSGSEHRRAASESLDAWIKPVGETAAPVLAGFSVTVVIVVSDDAKNFRWPGWAILALAIAAIALIAALQSAKYAREKRWPGANRTRTPKWWKRIPYFGKYFNLPPRERTEFWQKWTRRFYHLGLAALLAGLAFSLAPPNNAEQESFRWAASVLSFAACAIETFVFLTAGGEYRPAYPQSGTPRNPPTAGETSSVGQSSSKAAE